MNRFQYPLFLKNSATSFLRGGALLSAIACTPAPEGEFVSKQQRIIEGTNVSASLQASLGIVRVNDCTGTLLSNRIVLTARHCVRAYNVATNVWGGMLQSLDVGFVDAQLQWVADPEQLLEPEEALWPAASDYALILLARPFILDGSNDEIFREISDLSAGQLGAMGETALCAGYGANQLADPTQGTYVSGSGVLRSAYFGFEETPVDVLRVNPNSAGQIYWRGDSGSTCFLNGMALGVMSTCYYEDEDIDGNGTVSSNEVTQVNYCHAAYGDTYRSWVRERYIADIALSYTFSPVLNGADMPNFSIVTPKDSLSGQLSSGTTNISEIAVRGGFVSVDVDEPPRTMCTQFDRPVEVQGDVTLHGSCLSDGLLPVLL